MVLGTSFLGCPESHGGFPDRRPTAGSEREYFRSLPHWITLAMAVETNGRPANGRPVEPAKANGRPNGHVPYQAKSLKSKPPTSFAGRVTGLVARYAKHLWPTG